MRVIFLLLSFNIFSSDKIEKDKKEEPKIVQPIPFRPIVPFLDINKIPKHQKVPKPKRKSRRNNSKVMDAFNVLPNAN